MTCAGPGRAPRDDDAGDRGFTLIEVVVAMAIMSFVMAIFTTGILQIYRLTNRTEASSTSQSQLGLVFLRLDREIRYAAGISLPGAVGPDPYVEYLTTATGTPICTQLRLRTSARQLHHRSWPQGSLPGATNPWRTLAFEVTSAQPFTFVAPDSDAAIQRLRLRLGATSGAGSTAATRNTDLTFAALNTSADTASSTVCTEGRAIP